MPFIVVSVYLMIGVLPFSPFCPSAPFFPSCPLVPSVPFLLASFAHFSASVADVCAFVAAFLASVMLLSISASFVTASCALLATSSIESESVFVFSYHAQASCADSEADVEDSHSSLICLAMVLGRRIDRVRDV